MIELDSIVFGYDAQLVLSGLSLCVEPGEIVGVLGPNGAGKSTLVRIALGLLAPSAGRMRIRGADLSTLSRREIATRIAAMVQDEPAGFPMTVKECVLLGRLAYLPAHGFETDEDLVAGARAMTEVGVDHLAERMLYTLSSGERRRVLLGRALAQAAPALVLDEPAANLDLAHQLELFALLRARAVAGGAILVTIHDLNLAMRACDRVLLIEAVDRVAVGPPAEILTVERVARVFGVQVERGQTSDGMPYLAAMHATK